MALAGAEGKESQQRDRCELKEVLQQEGATLLVTSLTFTSVRFYKAPGTHCSLIPKTGEIAPIIMPILQTQGAEVAGARSHWPDFLEHPVHPSSQTVTSEPPLPPLPLPILSWKGPLCGPCRQAQMAPHKAHSAQGPPSKTTTKCSKLLRVL